MDKMKFESPDMTAKNIEKIAALFPNCATERKVYKRALNFERFRQTQPNGAAIRREFFMKLQSCR